MVRRGGDAGAGQGLSVSAMLFAPEVNTAVTGKDILRRLIGPRASGIDSRGWGRRPARRSSRLDQGFGAASVKDRSASMAILLEPRWRGAMARGVWPGGE